MEIIAARIHFSLESTDQLVDPVEGAATCEPASGTRETIHCRYTVPQGSQLPAGQMLSYEWLVDYRDGGGPVQTARSGIQILEIVERPLPVSSM
jgi:hypothetical protein